MEPKEYCIHCGRRIQWNSTYGKWQHRGGSFGHNATPKGYGPSPKPNNTIKIVKIPITKNLSTDVVDFIGTLDIPQDMADDMAEYFANYIGFRLDACVEILEGKPTLKLVSISPVPVDSE